MNDSHLPRLFGRIAIVGGGPGGLLTCWQLERQANAPLDITIFEASERIGGKLLTPRFSVAPVSYEAGAAELYGYDTVGDDPLRDLVRDLGLATQPLAGSAVFVGGRRIANGDDLVRAFGAEARDRFTAFDLWARSAISAQEYFDSGADHATSAVPQGRFSRALAAIGSSSVQQYVETMIHSDLATEPTATTIGYGLQNYLMNDPASMRLYRIVGGNEQLVRALAARIQATINLESAITQVTSCGSGTFAVSWEHDGLEIEDIFDTIIMALPIPALARIAFHGAGLGEAMRRHIAHHDHPADYLRVSFLIDGPVPAACGEDDYIMVDAFGGACLYVETSRDPIGRYGVLGWLLGGDAAKSLAPLSDESLVAKAIAALPASFASCRRRILETRVHRWTGAVSAVPGGWTPLPVATRHRPSPADSSFFVVGDYLYDSTLNGVFDSAEYVAGWVTAANTDKSSAGSSSARESMSQGKSEWS